MRALHHTLRRAGLARLPAWRSVHTPTSKVPPKVQQEQASCTDRKLVESKHDESLATKAARAAEEVVSHVRATVQGIRDQVLRGGPSVGEHAAGNKLKNE